MDLAYDRASDALIASVLGGHVEKTFALTGAEPGMIYRVDRRTGAATLLNGNAPVMLGLAESVPEPSTGILLASALLVWVFGRPYWR
jgi:hypothetical protein